MNVATILKQKGRAVATLAPSATLVEAARSLAQRRIGAIVIADGHMRVVGILSERDIVRVVAQSGPRVLEAPIADVMTRTVITCREDDTIEHLMQEMTRGRFRHLPVVDADGKLCGIISIGDVVKHHLEAVERDADALRAYIAHA